MSNNTDNQVSIFFKNYQPNKLESLIHLFETLVPKDEYRDIVTNCSEEIITLTRFKRIVTQASSGKMGKITTNEENLFMNSVIRMNNYISEMEKTINNMKIENEGFIEQVKQWRDSIKSLPGIKKQEISSKPAPKNSLNKSEVYNSNNLVENLSNVPPTPPPSRSTSGVNSSESLSKAAKLAEVKSILPKNDKLQETSFLRGYDITRLYSFYGIYFKLGGITPGKDPWDTFDAMIIKLKSIKESYNKSGEINDEMFEVVSAIDGMIFLFGENLGEKLKGIQKDFKDDESEDKKLFHYSRFIRVFKNNYKATPDVITSLLHVYEYELKLWKDAIEPPPKVEIPVVVAEDTEDQLNAVRTFLSRFDQEYKYKENAFAKIKVNEESVTIGGSDSVNNTSIDGPKEIISTVGEEDIRFFISILKKIATDEKFKNVENKERPNVNVEFGDRRSDELVLMLEGNLADIKRLKERFDKDKTQKNIFINLTKILENTTNNINNVEKFLNSRKKLCKTNDFISLIKEGIITEKSVHASFTAHLTMSTFIISFFGIIIVGSLTVASGGAILGALILSAIICAAAHCAIYPIEYAVFSFKDRFMHMLYGKAMTYIWKKNGWGEFNKEEVWNETIQHIEPFFKSPYEFVWGVMLYTGKRVEWDKQMEPFFSQNTNPRDTFMDKKNEAMKKADEAFKKMASVKMSKSSKFGFTLPSLMKINFQGPPLSSIFRVPKFRWTKKSQKSSGTNNKTMQLNKTKKSYFFSLKRTEPPNKTPNKNEISENADDKPIPENNRNKLSLLQERVRQRKLESLPSKKRHIKPVSNPVSNPISKTTNQYSRSESFIPEKMGTAIGGTRPAKTRRRKYIR